ncbi:MAG: dihydrodipicolinate synthase family protein, partial [Desulfocapsaceae bacterium]
MVSFRRTVEKYGPIPAMKGMLAVKREDSRWRNVRPPIVPSSTSDTEALIQELGGELNLL